MSKVLISIPCHDGNVVGGITDALANIGHVDATMQRVENSFLTWNFNRAWCHALNLRRQGFTHWLLHHNDIEVETVGWLRIMLDEMETKGASVLSAVVPIKNDQGITSTGIDLSGHEARHPWPVRRLTMTEAYQLPETFDGFDCQDLAGRWGYTFDVSKRLLLNTGLMLVDMRQPWASGDFCFRFQNVNMLDQDGKWTAFAEPEDWNWSRQLNAAGVPTAATTKIELAHRGVSRFTNNTPWGVPTDPAFA